MIMLSSSVPTSLTGNQPQASYAEVCNIARNFAEPYDLFARKIVSIHRPDQRDPFHALARMYAVQQEMLKRGKDEDTAYRLYQVNAGAFKYWYKAKFLPEPFDAEHNLRELESVGFQVPGVPTLDGIRARFNLHLYEVNEVPLCAINKLSKAICYIGAILKDCSTPLDNRTFYETVYAHGGNLQSQLRKEKLLLPQFFRKSTVRIGEKESIPMLSYVQDAQSTCYIAQLMAHMMCMLDGVITPEQRHEFITAHSEAFQHMKMLCFNYLAESIRQAEQFKDQYSNYKTIEALGDSLESNLLNATRIIDGDDKIETAFNALRVMVAQIVSENIAHHGGISAGLGIEEITAENLADFHEVCSQGLEIFLPHIVSKWNRNYDERLFVRE